jgi:hypothetical protein
MEISRAFFSEQAFQRLSNIFHLLYFNKDLGEIQIKICETQITSVFSLDFHQNNFEKS